MTREEAIETLRNNVCNSHHVYDNALPTIIEALETLIPELAENEYERVEKLITDSVFYQYGAGAEYRDVLDYLGRHNSEKQKEQKPIKMEVYETGKGTTICGQDYKCKNDYKTGTCWYIKDAIYHCSRDGYLTDQNGVSWSCTPEWFNEYIQTNAEWAEEEKTRFVSGQFLQCKLSFDGFKEGEHYWLEYVGDDMYVGRSDNILNQKFHITPRQLYTLFSQQLEEKQKEQKPIKWTDLTWKDIIELEGIINNVHYEFRNGIGQESFGKEVLEKFREYKGDEYLDEMEQNPTAKINGEPISTENQTVKVGYTITQVLNAYREGRNAGRKEVFDHPEYYGLQLRRMYDYETGRRNPEWSEEDKEQIEIFDADKFFAGKDVNDFKKELFLVIRGARELKPTDEEIWQNIESQIAPCLVDILQEGVESAEPKRKFKIGDVVTNGQDIYTIHLMGSDRYWLKEDDCVTIPFEYEDDWNKVEPKFKVGDKIKFSSEPKYPAREIVEIKDSAYYFDSAVHLPFAKQDEWELVEEKPAGWSEEDESNAVFILESLDGLLRYCKKNKEGAHQSKQIKEAQEWIKTRLKSIKPQLETNGEEYIRNLENLESIVYYAKSLPDDTRTKLGNFLQSLRTRKTCGVDEFSLTLRNCLSTDSELTDEQADTFARAYGEDLYKVALGEISTGLDKWDIEEYRNETKLYPDTKA